MERIKTGAFNAVIHHKKTILILFGGMIIFSLFAMGFVSVNYDMAAYLPEDAVSTVALQKMGDEYGTGVPNARLMFEDVSLPEAISIKNELLSIDGVQDVLWLDSTHNLKEPLEAQDQKGAEAFYKDNNALYNVTLEAEKEISAMNSIREKFGDKVAMAGPAINIGAATDTSDEEVLLSTAVIVPMCFLVLFFTTTSWFEPFLFMGVIGVAILINAGTNIFLGEISFVTNAAQSILQLAVSMDYSIFLLHRFTEKRAEGLEIEEAMVEALKSSFSSITASGITTVIGFAALILMRFKIGPDMGIVMAKAIFISLLSVLLLMPVLVIYCYRLVEKTQHRSFLPSFEKLGNLVYKIKLPMMIIFLLLILPSFLAKDQNEFYYGSSMVFGEETTQVGRDTKKINDTFGKANNFVIMVPKGDIGKEVQLSQELRTIPQILEIISYVDTVGAQIPLEFLDKTTTSQLLSQNYSRMILVLDVDYEGEYAFGVVDQIKAVAEKYYGDSYYMAGETVNTYDLKTTIVADNPKVNAVAIIAVFLVLVIGLKSLMLPFLLVLTIETAIWVNMSVPYFTGKPMFFIAYLIVSSIQLGATVDYAILLTNRQLEERENMDRKAALIKTTMTTTGSIMTSGLIMTIGCLILGAVSKNEVLSQLGTLIGRGALLSMAAVIFVLPALLYYFDKIIEKTTKNVHFYKAKEEK